MLTCLRIRDLAIIRELEIELGPGLNIITGETGAGKSILLAALQLVLGARGSGDLVRTGAEQAVVEALFDLTRSPDLRRRVADSIGIEDDELVVRRVVRRAGRSRAYLNGTLATAVQLAKLTADLVDICSQHEHHSLVDGSTHLLYLDAFASLDGRRGAMASAWRAYSAVADELQALVDAVRERTDREAILRFQLDEIDSVDPEPDEEDVLQAEHERLAHAERLAQATHAAERAIYASDGALASKLARLAHSLADIRGVDARLDPLIDRLHEVHTELEDLGQDLGDYHRGVVHDPSRLAAIDERLGALRRLTRKYGGSIEALLAHRDRARSDLARLDDLESQLDQLESRRQAAVDDVVGIAQELSAARRGAAAKLGEAITDELQSLGMGNARVQVDVARLEQRSDSALEVEGVRFSESGMDRVEFLIAPNAGEPPKPLRKIASGGELSRSLLAVKRVLASRGPSGLYVFDEVDTGVGGAIAEVIGRKLDEVAHHHQVLCITHQPQIAAYARSHFHVRKHEVDGRTESVIESLDHAQRREELARMLGGLQITDTTRQAAEELLESAAEARQDP